MTVWLHGFDGLVVKQSGLEEGPNSICGWPDFEMNF